jgi:hypothetical protein
MPLHRKALNMYYPPGDFQMTTCTNPLGRPRHRWVDNIKIDLRKIVWDAMYWIELAQDRDQWRALVNMVMNLWVP